MFDSLVKIFRKSLPVSQGELAPLRAKIEIMLKGSEMSTSLRGWVECRAVSLYLRVSRRRFTDLGILPTLELGSITVNVAAGLDYQQRGICTATLAMLENLAVLHGRVVYVENVLNEDLDRHLRRRIGYHACNGGFGHHSYFWIPDGLQNGSQNTTQQTL